MSTYISSRAFTKDGEMILADVSLKDHDQYSGSEEENIFPYSKYLADALNVMTYGKHREQRGMGLDPDYTNLSLDSWKVKNPDAEVTEICHEQMYECSGWDGFSNWITVEEFENYDWDIKLSDRDDVTLREYLGESLFNVVADLKESGTHYIFFFVW